MLAENMKTHFSVFFITVSAEEIYVELNLEKKKPKTSSTVIFLSMLLTILREKKNL